MVPGDAPSSTPRRQHSCPPPKWGGGHESRSGYRYGSAWGGLRQADPAGTSRVSRRQAASGDLLSAAQDEVAADDEQGEGEYPRAK